MPVRPMWRFRGKGMGMEQNPELRGENKREMIPIGVESSV